MRKSCFGSRSVAGCRFVEPVLSVQATCAQQQRSFFSFVTEAVVAAWAGKEAPTLIPVPGQTASRVQKTVKWAT